MPERNVLPISVLGSIMLPLDMEIRRSWRAQIQAALHRSRPIPGALMLSRTVGFVGRWRRQRALLGDACIKTIVVGSQTLGGAGKTPVVLYLAHRLCADFRVGVLVRPTRRGSEFEGMVQSRHDAERAGDEALMLWLRLPPNSTLFVMRDLVKGQRLAEGAVDCLIVDDGLRKAGLSSNLSIVVIDYGASNLLFPQGPCREDESILAYADLVWLNKVDEPPKGRSVRADVESRYQPVGLVNGQGDQLELGPLLRRSVTLVSGIGRPESFYHSVMPYVGNLARVLEYGDHEVFDFPAPLSEAELVVTTEKDLARGEGGPNVWALRVELVLESGYSDLAQRLREMMA